MSVNKVQLANGETIIDISDSTVTPETLAEGVTAHDASGQKITGKMVQGGGKTVQTDWNQTDETALDFLKNKPFGEVSGDVLIDGEMEFFSEDGLYMTEAAINLVVGAQYEVTWDGVVYTCTAADGAAVGAAFLLGNLNILGISDSTGEPFVFIGGIIATTSEAENHYVKVQEYIVEKIPSSFLPGRTAFYAKDGKDPYIYAAHDIKATLIDVQKADVVAPILVISLNYGYLTPVRIRYADYASVFVAVGDGVKEYYTAEYVPPETTT